MTIQVPARYDQTRVVDLTRFYSAFVPFTVNSIYPIHRWYKFKEGYSKDLVHLILGSLGTRVQECLDPFGGSGTTALACQEVGIRCHSIEVNPFLHHLAKVKMRTRYGVKGFDSALRAVEKSLKTVGKEHFPPPIMSTITKRADLDKYLFSPPVLQAILSLRASFKKIHWLYADLFLITLSSILTEIGNTTKDGKCVRYKTNWQSVRLTRGDVYEQFFDRARIFREDIVYIQQRKGLEFSNAAFCVNESSLTAVSKMPANSVDAIITSPPYLNSFDYTDVYMPELWALGFVENYEKVKQLRAKTLCSHVQVKWQPDESAFTDAIKLLLLDVNGGQNELWNGLIPKMIAGYFLDMQNLLLQLKRVLRPSGRLCIVVGTSSYNKTTIPTDWVLGGLAEDIGFKFDELRVVREFNRSTQQSGQKHRGLPPLRESILMLTAPASPKS